MQQNTYISRKCWRVLTPASSVQPSSANYNTGSITISLIIGGNPDIHSQVTDSTDKYMVFKQTEKILHFQFLLMI